MIEVMTNYMVHQLIENFECIGVRISSTFYALRPKLYFDENFTSTSYLDATIDVAAAIFYIKYQYSLYFRYLFY